MLIYLQMIETEADQTKFEIVYQKYRGLMFYVAHQILRSERDAEDAVHEAFVAIAKNIKKISDPKCTKTKRFVVIIAENKAIDIYRKRRDHPEAELCENVAGVEIEIDSCDPVAAAIAKLPGNYRELILLKYSMGYSNKDCAKILGLSYEGIHSLDQRAKNKLKELLGEEGVLV